MALFGGGRDSRLSSDDELLRMFGSDMVGLNLNAGGGMPGYQPQLVQNAQGFYEPEWRQRGPQSMPQPAPRPVVQPAPEPVFSSPMPTVRPAVQFTDPVPIAPPPSQTFVEQARTNVAPPPTSAFQTPAGPAPAPIPIVSAPSHGLLNPTPYSPAPEVPGYAQPRTGNPFRARNAGAALGGLFGQISANQLGAMPSLANHYGTAISIPSYTRERYGSDMHIAPDVFGMRQRY